MATHLEGLEDKKVRPLSEADVKLLNSYLAGKPGLLRACRPLNEVKGPQPDGWRAVWQGAGACDTRSRSRQTALPLLAGAQAAAFLCLQGRMPHISPSWRMTSRR